MNTKRGSTLWSLIALVSIIVVFSFGISKASKVDTGNNTGTDSSLQSTKIEGQNIPDPTGYVNDKAGALSPSTVSINEAKLNKFSETGKGEIAVLVVSSLDGLTIEEYGIRVAEKWKVGKYGQNTGNILIISIGDRKVRIETGSGSKITDAQAAQIIQTSMISSLKRNDWDGAVNAGVDALITATN